MGSNSSTVFRVAPCAAQFGPIVILAMQNSL